MKDLKNNITGSQSLTVTARTASANGTGVDLKNELGAVAMVIVQGWTDGTHAISLEHSDDNSTFVAVPAGSYYDSYPSITSAANNGKVLPIGYNGGKRYLRAVATVSGTTTGAIYGVLIVAGTHKKDSLGF